MNSSLRLLNDKVVGVLSHRPRDDADEVKDGDLVFLSLRKVSNHSQTAHQRRAC
jgi:hypothetical protein